MLVHASGEGRDGGHLEVVTRGDPDLLVLFEPAQEVEGRGQRDRCRRIGGPPERGTAAPVVLGELAVPAEQHLGGGRVLLERET